MSNNNHKLVWDIPTRLFHWLLVALVAFSWYSVDIEENLDWHFISGYCVLALLIFRLFWGIFGTYHARFRNFIYSPGEILNYAKGSLNKDSRKYAGHNPLGALSVFALLLFLLTQAVTGLFSNDEDYYFGPLSDYVSTRTADILTEIHHINFNIVLALIALHILAIVFYVLYKKQALIRAMITGKKLLEADDDQFITESSLWKATTIASLAGLAVYLLVSVFAAA